MRTHIAGERNRRGFAFLKLPWASLDQSVEFQEDELLAHFEENRETFRIPEQRVIDYLLVNRRELQDSLTLEDGATRAYYDANPDEFNRKEQIRARHILLQVNDQRTAGEARSQLEDARRQLDSGADFAVLAAELSDDPGSKARGGDLGLFGRGDMVAPFDQAAFSAEIGEIVGPVETDFGLHLIEVLEKRPGGSVEFSLAEEGIRTRLLAERAQTAAEEKANEIAATLRDDQSAGLEAIAEETVGVTFLTTIPFGRNDNVPGIGRAGQFTVAAFGLADAEISDPVSVAQGWAILSLKAVNEPRLPELDDVRAEAEASLREAKLQRQAVERMAAEALRIADGGSLDSAASNLDLEVEESVLFGRDDVIGSLGRAPLVAEAALELDEGGFGGPVETADGSVLFEVVERRHFDSKQFAEEKSSTKETLESQRLNELLGALLEERRSQMEIRVRPAVDGQLRPRQPDHRLVIERQ